jgi:predicted PurR-regulated permease PerM
MRLSSVSPLTLLTTLGTVDLFLFPDQILGFSRKIVIAFFLCTILDFAKSWLQKLCVENDEVLPMRG